MHIDFHLYGTYLAARVAGFKDTDARKIACAAQAVDDFILGEYSSVRGTTDTLSSEDKDVVQTTWTLFHFLPSIVKEKKLTLDEKESEAGMKFFATGPRSFLSNKVINALVNLFNETSEIAEGEVSQNKKLASAGVAMHVLADTFAHEGFSGLCSPHNIVKEVKIKTSDGERALGVFSEAMRHVPVWLARIFSSLDIGHGMAGHMPDISWAEYSYKKHGSDELTVRDNTIVFTRAFAYMVKVLTGIIQKKEIDAINTREIESVIKNALTNYARDKKVEFAKSIDAISETKDDFFAKILDEPKKISEIIPDCCTVAVLREAYEEYLESIKKIARLGEDFVTDVALSERLRQERPQDEPDIEALKRLVQQEWSHLSVNPFFFATLWHRSNILPHIWKYAPDYPRFMQNPNMQ